MILSIKAIVLSMAYYINIMYLFFMKVSICEIVFMKFEILFANSS